MNASMYLEIMLKSNDTSVQWGCGI